MQLTTGQILGDFEILEPLGRGGMGEVHLARDRKLGRNVAVKVLPAELAQHVNRRLRFEREARILALLNHPNIASIYGLHEHEGLLFLVMELAPGETLSERVRRKPLPVREAMLIAREIAAALEYAHAHNVIHRDLKPANVVVTPDESVKVLDFGLAKALKTNPDASDDASDVGNAAEPGQEGATPPAAGEPATREFDTDRSIPFEGATAPGDRDLEPFATIPAAEPFKAQTPAPAQATPAPAEREEELTRAGAVVGTPLYMSPEQARGKELDTRSDIWAFGCLLYEMLSGVNSFHGESVSRIVTRILEEDPDWERLPLDTPPGVVRLLRRCLNKNIQMRLQHIGDARVELTEMLNEPVAPEAAPLPEPAGVRVRGKSLVLFLLGVMAGTLISLVAAWSGKRPGDDIQLQPKLVGLDLVPPISWPGIRDLSMAIAPDGEAVVYIAREGSESRLLLRPMDSMQTRPLPGTEGATAACFSPDGSQIAFVANGELKKIDLAGESITTLVRGYERIASPAWPRVGGIMFTPFPARGIWMIDAEGGEPHMVTTPNPEAGELMHGWPTLIPTTSILLFTVWPEGEDAQPWIEVLDLITGPESSMPKRTKLIEGGQLPHFDPLERAVVYAQNGTIFAHHFDPREMAFRSGSKPMPILRGVSRHPQSGLAQYDMAFDGSLVYLSGEAPSAAYRLLSVAPGGEPRELFASETELSGPRLSPDGTRLAVTRAGINTDIWLMQRDGRNPLRLTDAPGYDAAPLWSPDGKAILFSSVGASSPSLQVMSSDGIGTPSPLLLSAARVRAESWSTAAQALALSVHDPARLGDIYLHATTDSASLGFGGAALEQVLPTLTPYRVTERDERHARFSPDGRWIAYQQADANGVFEIYVQPYGHEATLVRVSAAGGTQPAWGRATPQGRELFFLQPEGLMRVIFDGEEGGLADEPELVAAGDFTSGYDVDPATGERYVVERVDRSEDAPRLNMFLDWRVRMESQIPEAVRSDSDRTTGTGRGPVD